MSPKRTKNELSALAWEACKQIVETYDMDDSPQYDDELIEEIYVVTNEMEEQAIRLRNEDQIARRVHGNLKRPEITEKEEE